MRPINRILLLCLLNAPFLHGQLYSIEGKIQSIDNPLAFANVFIKRLEKGTVADEKGAYKLEGLRAGVYSIEVSFTGYISVKKEIQITNQNRNIDFQLEADSFLEEVVITGTRTFKRKTNTPVIVNILSSTALDNVQACNLSEGLKFQPGLRVETNCQTCNYTQLRMNGLAGGYSQILINGRPIFSPLTGLYGLEQIPVNMIERIETIRGGGSTLYGSSAIGGVVNVITKIPKSNNIEISYAQQSIKSAANENIFNGNATLVSKDKSTGIALFANKRTREYYDANGDNFSELPALENTAYGASLFYLPNENQKLEASISHLNEYRYGGEMVDQTAHLNQQAEDRTHDVWMGSLDYKINFNEDKSALIGYLSGQRTNRDHYTGIFPDDPAAIETHLSSPPYGISETTTFQGGAQFNYRVNRFFKGTNVFILGGEYLKDAVL
ncbi:MAG: TonB-dependent receptor, partial [Flavobacteriaceae bacterium]|nr:TonB-dependent receptor [Flavobacteriaceae bacterium]